MVLFLWFLSHVYYFRDVPQDLAPWEYNIFKDNSGIFPWSCNISIPGNTVTEDPGGLSKWVQSQSLRRPSPFAAHAVSI